MDLLCRSSARFNHNVVELARLTSRLVRYTIQLTRSMCDFDYDLVQPDSNMMYTARNLCGVHSDPVHSSSRTVQYSRRCAQPSHDAIQPARPLIATAWHLRDFARSLIHPARRLIQVARDTIQSA
jgi:hypothetical protein